MQSCKQTQRRTCVLRRCLSLKSELHTFAQPIRQKVEALFLRGLLWVCRKEGHRGCLRICTSAHLLVPCTHGFIGQHRLHPLCAHTCDLVIWCDAVRQYSIELTLLLAAQHVALLKVYSINSYICDLVCAVKQYIRIKLTQLLAAQHIAPCKRVHNGYLLHTK